MSRTVILCPVFAADATDTGLLRFMIRDGSLLDHVARLAALLGAGVLVVTDMGEVEAFAHAQGVACRRISRSPGRDPFPAFPGLGQAAAHVARECSETAVLAVNWRNVATSWKAAANVLQLLREQPGTPVVGAVEAEDNPVQFHLLFDFVAISLCCLLDGPDPDFPDLTQTHPFPCDFGLLAPGLPRRESLAVLVGTGPLQAMIPGSKASETLRYAAARTGRLYRREDEKTVRRLVSPAMAVAGFVSPFPTHHGQTATWIREGDELCLALRAEGLIGPVTGFVHACAGLHLGKRYATFHHSAQNAALLAVRRRGSCGYVLLCRVTPPPGATGLAAAVVRPTSGPQADFMSPMPPLGGLWEHAPGKGLAACLPDGRVVVGRQAFPDVYEMDVSLVAAYGKGLPDLGDELAAGRVRGCRVDSRVSCRLAVQANAFKGFGGGHDKSGLAGSDHADPLPCVAPSAKRSLVSFGEGMALSYYVRPDEDAAADVDPCFRYAVWHEWNVQLRFRHARVRAERRFLARVQRAMSASDPEQAGRLLEKYVSLRPSVRHAAWCLIARMWRRAGACDKAAWALDMARDSGYPQPAWKGELEREHWLVKAKKRLHRSVGAGQWAQAIPLCQKMLRFDQDEPVIWEVLACAAQGEDTPVISQQVKNLENQFRIECVGKIPHERLPYPWHFCQLSDGTMFFMGHQNGFKKGILYRVDPNSMNVFKLNSGYYYTGFVPDIKSNTFWGICVRDAKGCKRQLQKIDKDGQIIKKIDFACYDKYCERLPVLLRVGKDNSAYFCELGHNKIYRFDMQKMSIELLDILKKQEHLAGFNILNNTLHIFLQNSKALILYNMDLQVRKKVLLSNVPAFPFSISYGDNDDVYILSRRFVGEGFPCNSITKLDGLGNVIFSINNCPSMGAPLYLGKINESRCLVFMDPLSQIRFYKLREKLSLCDEINLSRPFWEL